MVRLLLDWIYYVHRASFRWLRPSYFWLMPFYWCELATVENSSIKQHGVEAEDGKIECFNLINDFTNFSYSLQFAHVLPLSALVWCGKAFFNIKTNYLRQKNQMDYDPWKKKGFFSTSITHVMAILVPYSCILIDLYTW